MEEFCRSENRCPGPAPAPAEPDGARVCDRCGQPMAPHTVGGVLFLGAIFVTLSPSRRFGGRHGEQGAPAGLDVKCYCALAVFHQTRDMSKVIASCRKYALR